MILFGKKEECCGCLACTEICPKQAIEIKQDNKGFLYPRIEKDKCIECGACLKVCPFKAKNENSGFEKKCYAVKHSEDVRMSSSSGGAYAVAYRCYLPRRAVFYAV